MNNHPTTQQTPTPAAPRLYRGDDPAEILERARRELGPRARVLPSARPAPGAPLEIPLLPDPETRADTDTDTHRELLHPTAPTLRRTPLADDLLASLGLPTALLESLRAELPRNPDGRPAPLPDTEALAELLAARIRTAPSLIAAVDAPAPPVRTVALVGPPRAGRTTAAAQILARRALRRRPPDAPPPRLLLVQFRDNPADTWLEGLLEILRVPRLLLDPRKPLRNLDLELRAGQPPELVVVDVPPVQPDDADLPQRLRELRARDVRLVLDARRPPRSLREAVERHAPLAPRALWIARWPESPSEPIPPGVAAVLDQPLGDFASDPEILRGTPPRPPDPRAIALRLLRAAPLHEQPRRAPPDPPP